MRHLIKLKALLIKQHADNFESNLEKFNKNLNSVMIDRQKIRELNVHLLYSLTLFKKTANLNKLQTHTFLFVLRL